MCGRKIEEGKQGERKDQMWIHILLTGIPHWRATARLVPTGTAQLLPFQCCQPFNRIPLFRIKNNNKLDFGI